MAQRELQAEQRKRAFAAAFLGEANRDASKAARLAGYKAKGGALAVQGTRLLKDPLVRQLLEQHAKRADAKAEDVMRVLVDQMGASFEDFLRLGADGQAEIDLEMAKDRGKLHLIRKVRQRRTTQINLDNNTQIVTVDTDVELHDAQKAARHVGEALGMFVRRTEDLTKGNAGRRPSMERIIELLLALGLDPVKALRRIMPGVPVKQIEAKVLETKTAKPKETT